VFQRLTGNPGIRVVPLDREAIASLTAEGESLVPLTLPAGTYPLQNEPVPTVAVTALLVARQGMPEIEVTTVLNTVFNKVDFIAAGSAAGALIAQRRAGSGLARSGITNAVLVPERRFRRRWRGCGCSGWTRSGWREACAPRLPRGGHVPTCR
jgi:TRAP-type uncharacterized transport system substrate-binding protein